MSKPHKEVLNKHKLNLLKKAARHIEDTGKNEFPIKIFSDNMNDYCNLQKCRLHGLIHHARSSDGSIKRGKWLITRTGWSFLGGKLSLPKWVMVRDNEIVSRCADQVKVQQVYYGSEAVHTTFDYFSEDGLPIGVKPLKQVTRQTALI